MDELEGSASSDRVDSLGTSLALSGASRDKADKLLDEQTDVLRLQKSQLEDERRLNLSHLRFRRFSDHAKSALEIAAGLVVLLIVCGLSAMVWNAAHDHDLVIEAFSVPPDMAQSGMTGSVVAARVLDQFGAMQAETFSIVQGAGSYHGYNPETVRVQIPETGISIGELDRYLRDWLGSERHVTGDMVHTPSGIALTVRYDSEPGATFDGASSDLDRLVHSAAEHVFAAARPLRYIDYLAHERRYAEAEALIPSFAMQGDDHQRALAYASWAGLLMSQGDMYGEREKALTALRLDPVNPSALAFLSGAENNLEHEEGAYRYLGATLRSSSGSRGDLLDPRTRVSMPVFWTLFRDEEVGDFSGAIAALTGAAAKGLPYYANHHALDSILDHDIGAAERIVPMVAARSRAGRPNFDVELAELLISTAVADWPAAVRWGAKADVIVKATPERLWEAERDLWPPWAEAMAHNGALSDAEALIARTPVDCDDCARKRGRIAAINHDWAAAARWFAIVSQRSPSIPFADTDWGQMLLGRGDVNGAITKFASASAKGPHFADPLEMWGEALMAANRSDLALGKFAEAEKYAPNWGRLHLEWGEALLYCGRREEAKKQFAAAATLALSRQEKSALARQLAQF